MHHHLSQHDRSLLLDRHNIDQLESTTIQHDNDHNHNKLELSYISLLFYNKLTWTLTLMPTTATTLPWETNVLRLAVNEDKKERQLQQELMLDHAVLLPSYHYHDSIQQYDKQEVLTATKKELDKLRQKDMCEECDKSRKVVKTRWVVGDRPYPSTTTTTGVQPASEL